MWESRRVPRAGARIRRGRVVALALAWLVISALPSCGIFHVSKQQERLASVCRIDGSAQNADSVTGAMVVVLIREVPGTAAPASWKIVDYYVLEHSGPWSFAASPGRFRVAAFRPESSNVAYRPGEPFLGTTIAQPFDCAAGAHINSAAVTLPANPSERFDLELDTGALQAVLAEEQAERSLGQLTAVGEVAALTDSRFDLKSAEDGLWRPFDYMLASHPGIYFLEPYDPNRMPVLFVHGISGSPANFRYLIEHLDHSKFQAWVYNYPSGMYLQAVADHLNQTISKLQLRYQMPRFAVVAHSMGGLVARGFIQRHATSGGTSRIPLFVSIATPWDGHSAAALGVKYSPAVVHVWHDMAPGSDYLQSLFAVPLPSEIQFHLIFTFQRDSSSFGQSDDHTVTVASELRAAAQADAVRLYGFNDSHEEVLDDPAVSNLLNKLLAEQLQQ